MTNSSSSDATIAHYRLLKELSSGGQGAVYLAEDEKTKRRVALKVLLARHRFDSSSQLRMRREAEALAKLNHPGICAVYELGEDKGSTFIAMQYIEGETLHSRLRRERTTPIIGAADDHVSFGAAQDTPRTPKTDRAGRDATGLPDPAAPSARTSAGIDGVLRLFVKIARSLQAAHEVGIVHRDLKPGNVMVTPAGEPVLIDFGLAMLEGADSLTLTRDVVGTYEYMSPEHYGGKHVTVVDARSDVFSLGIMFYEALTHRHPFAEASKAALRTAIVTMVPRSPSTLNAAITRDLDTVVLTALEKDRGRRYASAGEFADEVERILRKEPIRARPAGPILKLYRWAQRNPLVAAMTASIILILAVSTAAQAVNSRRLRLKSEESEKNARAANEAAGNEKARALEARTNLEKFRQLAAAKRVSELIAEAEQALWPRRPEKIPSYLAWLDEARAVVGDLPGFRAAFDELAASAEGLSDADTRQEEVLRRRRYPDLFALYDGLRKKLDTARREAASEDKGPLAAAVKFQIERYEAEVRAVENDFRFSERQSYRFADPESARRFGALRQLLADLTTLGPLIRDVESRLAWARTIESRTKADDAWIGCLRDLSKDERFRNLGLEPRLDLLPLWKDDASNLWEFWHVPSGARPERVDGKVIVGASTGLILVLVPGGTLKPSVPRVAPRVGENATGSAADSAATVRVPAFLVSKFEMTQGQWLATMATNPSYFNPNDEEGMTLAHPVESVTWFEAGAAMRRLGLRLPMEIEWEYACRAGSTSKFWFGDDKTLLQTRANIADRSLGSIRSGASPEAWNDGFALHGPVGSLPPNPFGLHEVHGNVAEWCEDAEGELRGLTNSHVLPRRIHRGGSFALPAAAAESSWRQLVTPTLSNVGIGLRPVRDWAD